ncbi:MAG: DUF167 domain-containing protein [Candidatus Hydrogenedentes bacterium]|nr:DUF167 domain-containing protein [Candidatus Hydrogenedentota bacterium]
MSFVVESRDSVRIHVGVQNERLRIRLSAPPADGLANAALCALIAKKLHVPKSAVRLLSGDRSRDKTVEIAGVNEEAVIGLLTALESGGVS